MRLATLAIVVAALMPGSAAFAIGPPRPPQPGPLPPLPTTGTGVAGHVSRGSVTPICRVRQLCYRPARVTLTFGRHSAATVRVATLSTGEFRIALKPGVYTVSVASGLGRLMPSTVTVPASGWRRVNFVLSTGIY
jgi:hypothetical protein